MIHPWLIACLCACCLILSTACGPDSGAGRDGGPDALPVLPDKDGDGIADEHEGCREGRDSDGDGMPDCEDLDSDNDGIPDADEAGDDETYTPPRDADSDGVPDYLDSDSDNNGILDRDEGANDADGDGVADFADHDNDGDGLLDTLEMGGDPGNPRDSDEDGVPDMWDLDSDDDTIRDRQEGADDPDGDDVPSYLDLDSDDDCIADAAEAGDGALSTPPLDSDADGRYDFKDLDSDNDGLADSAEDGNCNGVVDAGETSATSADTDGDGVTDLVELAAGTDPGDAADNPQAHGDFVFVVPYEEPANPQEDDLDFSTNLRTVDVYVLADRSGSMSSEIDSIRDNIQEVANTVTCGAAQADPDTCIPDIWWGVGSVGYTGSGGEAFTHHLDMQADPTQITDNLPTEEPPRSSIKEPLLLALWSTATGSDDPDAAGCGDVIADYGAPRSCPDGIGYPCFRPDALPLILLATDEAPMSSNDTEECPGAQAAIDEANAIGAKIIGVLGSTNDAAVQPDLEELAVGTGAVDANNYNTPLVFRGDNDTASNAIATAIRLLAAGVPLDVSAVIRDDPSDAVDAADAFIGRLETQQLGTPECSSGLMQDDSNDDGHADLYKDVLPGTPVCWRLVPKSNTVVEPTDEPQLFKATIRVYGDSVALLDTRDVYFLVPPKPVENPIE